MLLHQHIGSSHSGLISSRSLARTRLSSSFMRSRTSNVVVRASVSEQAPGKTIVVKNQSGDLPFPWSEKDPYKLPVSIDRVQKLLSSSGRASHPSIRLASSSPPLSDASNNRLGEALGGANRGPDHEGHAPDDRRAMHGCARLPDLCGPEARRDLQHGLYQHRPPRPQPRDKAQACCLLPQEQGGARCLHPRSAPKAPSHRRVHRR